MSLKKILASEGIYPHPIDHGYDRPRSGGTDVMQELVQDLRQEQGLPRRASGEIPKRVQDAAEDFAMTIVDNGLRGTAKPFNSGYVGVVVDVAGLGKFLYLDQPGVVGLENQSEGYVAFGRYPMPDPRRGLVYKKHHARNFGDANLTRSEWEDAWQDVMMAFEQVIAAADPSDLRPMG